VSDTPTPEPPKPWHEAHPERLEWELGVFEEYGLPAEQTTSDDLVTIKTSLPFKGEEVAIMVVFPFHYPDVEPLVVGPAILNRHQNRRFGNFCLLDNPAAEWRPDLAAANLIDEDLRALLRDSEGGGEAVAAGEADMPEPLSEKLEAPRDPIVLVPDPFWDRELKAARGKLDLRAKLFGHGYVLAEAGGIGQADPKLIDPFLTKPAKPEIGRWVRLDDLTLPEQPSSRDLLDAAVKAAPELAERFKPGGNGRPAKRWLGVTFKEEGPRRGETRRGWLFLQVEVSAKKQYRLAGMAGAQALTVSERARRIPELAALSQAHFLIVGAGSLGAPIALELAKAGLGQIDLVDEDPYDVNNAVRHPLDPRHAGTEKTQALAKLCQEANPFIKVDAHQFKVGATEEAGARLQSLLAEADLVIDATASAGAARVLQRRCREFEIPLVIAALTAGSYGGEVAAFAPGAPCYTCFVYGQADGNVPEPARGPISNVTPIGCRTPAFSGAGFDATALAALAARTAIRAWGKSGYPDLDYDYVIVNFRGAEPWRQGKLDTHPDCPLCA
jgi:molybdopterin/thiamine biosynthesis adenylyltransferase